MLTDQKFQPKGIRERAREPHPSLPSSNLWRIFELERRSRCITKPPTSPSGDDDQTQGMDSLARDEKLEPLP